MCLHWCWTMGNKPYLTGDNFTVADAYLYTTLSWLPRLKIELPAMPKVMALFERARARPSVQQARKQEGLGP
jgi:glutathione S-transferase